MLQSRWRRRASYLLALALVVVALLFFLEWLGSEQPQKWVESPIAVPPEKGDSANGRR